MGNPQDETYYRYMKEYSPYDNVEAKAYPHMLVTTGLHDSGTVLGAREMGGEVA